MKRCALLLLVACGPVIEVAPPTQLHEAIVGGTLDAQDLATVALAVAAGGGHEQFCSGTLIGPRTVLTAAHCINAYSPTDTYEVLIGSNASAPAQVFLFASQQANPAYTGDTSDFGIIRLSTPVTNVTPIPLNTEPVEGWVGQPIRHVGFGVTNGTSQVGSGIKREVSYTLRTVHPMEMESGANGRQTCSGDSGGPAFMVPPGGTSEVLAGVVSWGDSACVVEGWDGRVDAVLPWIRTTMATWENPTCATDGACVPGCTPIDQDCACAADNVCSLDCLDLSKDPDCPRDCVQNGVCATQACPRPDPDCVATGGSCSNAQLCLSRLCLGDAQHPQTYCSQACSASSPCPNAMECTQGQCTFIQRPTKVPTDYCDAATDFCVQATICTGPTTAGTTTRCVKPCSGSADCLGVGTCEGGRDNQRYCRPTELSFDPPAILIPAFTELRQPVAKTGCTSAPVGPMLLGALAVLARRRGRRKLPQAAGFAGGLARSERASW